MFPMKLHLQSKKIMKMFVNHFGVILLPQNEAKMMKTIFWHYLFCISKKTKLGITWKKKGGGKGRGSLLLKTWYANLISLTNNLKSPLTCFSQHFSALGSALDLQAGVSVLFRHWQPSPVSFLQVSLCPLHWHLQIKMN